MRFAVRPTDWLTLLLLVAAAAHAEPVAVLAAVQGKVMLMAAHGRVKGPTPARFGTALEPGDHIAVGANSRATLCFNDLNVIELGAGSSLTISVRVTAGTVTGGDKLQKEVFSSLVSFRMRGSHATGLVAAPLLRSGESANTPEPLTPRNTDLLDSRPTLAWRAAPGATRYVVTLSGLTGEMWSHDTESTTFAFPPDAAPLAEGEYLWDVQAYDASGPVGRSSATFRLVPEVEAHAVMNVVSRMHESAGGADSPAARYLAGAYLCEHGFLAAAAEEFTALVRLAPDSPAPHEALGNVYRSLGLTELARASFQRAQEILGGR